MFDRIKPRLSCLGSFLVVWLSKKVKSLPLLTSLFELVWFLLGIPLFWEAVILGITDSVGFTSTHLSSEYLEILF